MSDASKKVILFLGATGGCGLSALRRSLAAGHTCIALCRTPRKLLLLLGYSEPSSTSPAPPNPPPPNLHILQGNAHSGSSLLHALTVSGSFSAHLVDIVVTSLGARPTLKGMDDPHVCERGVQALLDALQRLRKDHGLEETSQGVPHIVAVSSTGLSERTRDLPWLMIPMYRLLLGTAHADKRKMEKMLIESGEKFTVVRGSLYAGSGEGKIRVGVEDLVKGVVESTAIGYTISREDVGRWVFEEIVEGEAGKWVGKAATITY